MRLALVTVVAGRHGHLANQLAGVRSAGRAPEHHVVVAMGDGGVAAVCRTAAAVVQIPADPAALPLAAARNAGAEAALGGGAEALIFLDVDCIPSPDLFAHYRRAARDAPGSLLSGPVTYLPPPSRRGYDLRHLDRLRDPHPARPMPVCGPARLPHELFWSLSFCLTASTWRRIGGFCERYTGYGGEDTDFAYLARARGVPHVAVPRAHAFHQWHPVDEPPVAHLDDILSNGRLFKQRWGSWPMSGWLHEFAERGLVRHDPATDDYERCSDATDGEPARR